MRQKTLGFLVEREWTVPTSGVRDTKEGADFTTRLALFWCAYSGFLPRKYAVLCNFARRSSVQRRLLWARRVLTGISFLGPSFVGPGVGLVVNFGDVLNIDMSIDLGGRHIGMP